VTSRVQELSGELDAEAGAGASRVPARIRRMARRVPVGVTVPGC
jgi:hypothetical protein